MATRTRRLGRTSHLTTGSGATLTAFTVPTDRVAIIKDARCWLASTSVGAIWLPAYVQTAAGGVNFIGEWYSSVGNHAMARRNADLTVMDDPLWVVLEEGDALKLAQPAGCEINTYWSGTLLAGDAA